MSTVVLRNTKGSALSFTEMDNNFTNLNSDKLEELSTDTTPQLGGNLDVNGNSIVSTSDGNIAITPNGTGSVVLDGLNWPQADGTAGYVLKTDGAGNLDWVDVAADTNTTYTTSVVASGSDAIVRLTGSDATTDDVTIAAGTNITITPAGDTITIEAAAGSGIADVVEDTTPQLGGNLDVNGNDIVSVSNGTIRLSPNGTGDIDLNVATGNLTLNYATWPGADGTDGYVLKTDGAGNLDWVAQGSGLADIVDDTTPQLGGTLDGQGNTVQDVVLEDYAETIHALGSTDTPTISISNGNVQSVTITSGLTLPAFSDAATGQSVTLLVSGSGTASGTGSHIFAGGNNTLTTKSVVSIFYDGTNYWTSIATDFATV